ncbi:helical backbone metal receptor [Cytophagaceae bacterium ABcell3]|nr:helical backbone metal receptor [Cytophagaceae bacterium ABcell3]
MNFKDALGREVEVPLQPERIMGLSPSMTELLYAACGPEKVVARTQNCNYPESVSKLPVINNYPLDLELLIMLDPDLVFAIDGINNPADIAAIEGAGIPVVCLSFKRVKDITANIRVAGTLTGNTVNATALADSLDRELALIKEASKDLDTVKVLSVIWTDPIYIHGFNSIMTDKLSYINVVNLADSAMTKESPEVSLEYLIKKDPQVIAGTDLVNLTAKWPQLKILTSVQEKKVYPLTDDLQSRPGPRIVEAIKELNRVIRNEN